MAQAYARLGTKVRVLEATPYLLPAEDPELSTLLRGYLEAERVQFHIGRKVQKVVRNGGFQAHTDSGVYCAEQLLEAAGAGLGAKGEIGVNEYLQTRNPRIYAAGDGAGLPQYVYVAAQSGRIAARNALGRQEKLDLKAMPRVTFTDPAVATVGLSEEARKQYGSGIRVSRLPLGQLPKALVQHDQRGMFKLVVDAEGTVLGLSILASEAGDALQEAVLAVKFGLNYHDLIETFHPYLTLAEGVRLVAQALDTEVGMLSCCA
nr:FAD-dependent oxidoreductase [Meiothermus granaticius]